MKNFNSIDIGLFVVLITAAILSRFISHDWNLTLIGSASFLAGYFISNQRLAMAVPVVSLLITDLVIGFHNQMLEVYGCFILSVYLARYLGQKKSTLNAAWGSFVGASLFYIVTNFFSWIGNALYPQSFSGLMQSYSLALPFFRNQLVADVLVVTTAVAAYLWVFQTEKSEKVVKPVVVPKV